MSSLRRLPGPDYAVEYFPVEITEIANRERKVPDAWINAAGNNVTPECRAYLRPLIRGEQSCAFEDGIPKYVVLF